MNKNKKMNIFLDFSFFTFGWDYQSSDFSISECRHFGVYRTESLVLPNKKPTKTQGESPEIY